jgi:DNA polymerase III epsilon subunit-like protein
MDELEKFYNDVIVLDVETTGVDDDSDIIEFSASFPVGTYDSIDEVYNYTTRFKPTHDVPPEASSIHFIVNEDLTEDLPYSEKYSEFYPLFELKQYYVGHNVQFDRRMLQKNTIKHLKNVEIPELDDDNRWICTLRLAKKLFAEDPEFKNLTLSFLWFKFELYKTCTRKIVPHSAQDDVYMTYRVLSHLVNIAIKRGLIDINQEIGSQLIEFSNTPVIYSTMTIGKHKGWLMEDVPMNYFEFMIDKMDIMNPEMPNFDSDLYYTVEAELNRRMKMGLLNIGKIDENV